LNSYSNVQSQESPPVRRHALALADLFRLLGDASRLKIVVACLKKPLAVSDIADSSVSRCRWSVITCGS